MKKIFAAIFILSMLACSGSGTDSTIDKPDTPVNPEIPDEPVVDDTPLLCTDSPLVLELESVPEFGTSGTIRVFKASGEQVDFIDLADLSTVTIREDGQMIPNSTVTEATAMNTFLNPIKFGTRYRTVHYTPLRIKGKTLEITLHNSVLDFSSEYYVTVDEGVIKGHKGVAKGEWTFKTKAKPASKDELKVNPDGKSDFCTIQGALSYTSTLGKSAAVIISIANGTYNEMIFTRDKDNITLKGASRAGTILSYANNESYEGGSGASSSTKPGSVVATSGGRGVMLVENCNNLRIENLTMINSFGNLKGQAEVIYFNSGSNTHELTIENCELHSLQDTFLCKGIVWVHNSLIAGHTDYIWGYPSVCLFEDCEIRSVGAGTGFILQARVPSEKDKGFIFLNCNLTSGEGATTGAMYLARANDHSKEADGKKTFDNIVFVNCKMSSAIATKGWYNSPDPNPKPATATAGWREYKSTDASGNSIGTHDSAFGKILSDAEAENYLTREKILGK